MEPTEAHYKELLAELIRLHHAHSETQHEKIRVYLKKSEPATAEERQEAHDRNSAAYDRFRLHLNMCEAEVGIDVSEDFKYHKIHTGPCYPAQYSNHAMNLYPDYKVIQGTEHIYILAPKNRPIESELSAYMKRLAETRED